MLSTRPLGHLQLIPEKNLQRWVLRSHLMIAIEKVTHSFIMFKLGAQKHNMLVCRQKTVNHAQMTNAQPVPKFNQTSMIQVKEKGNVVNGWNLPQTCRWALVGGRQAWQRSWKDREGNRTGNKSHSDSAPSRS